MYTQKYNFKLVRESQDVATLSSRVRKKKMMTNFLCCLYLNKPCLPKESDCPAAGSGVGLSGGRGGKGVP